MALDVGTLGRVGFALVKRLQLNELLLNKFLGDRVLYWISVIFLLTIMCISGGYNYLFFHWQVFIRQPFHSDLATANLNHLFLDRFGVINFIILLGFVCR